MYAIFVFTDVPQYGKLIEVLLNDEIGHSKPREEEKE